MPKLFFVKSMLDEENTFFYDSWNKSEILYAFEINGNAKNKEIVDFKKIQNKMLNFFGN